ncbi:ABC transporter ATP-binding protein/permease [Clostridium swellfunianum]|uniref:ABC transporter ATP-binding protein n=1 Tax=Clostridium swellfunianum TaxID=1367462 RepID=UPI00202FC5F0|nr:ABC transporter ATP-binding protein [Clostridium swellfunianum]MCM0646957.1 ABC transporter ATP-binding protein/permease [Clostridium swellfunianum]
MEKYNEESLAKSYDSRLMKRLLIYAKPFRMYLIAVILLMLLGTGLDLLRPILIKNAIDNNINGYKKPYTMLQEPVANSIKIGDSYVAQGERAGGKAVTMLYYDKKYFIADGRVNEQKPYAINVDKLTQEGNTYTVYPLTSEELKVLRRDDVAGVIKTVIYTLLICISVFALGYVWMYLLQVAGQKIIYNIRNDLFKHVEGLSLSFFDKNPVGRLVTRVTNDVEALNEMYTGVLVYVFKDIFIIVGILIAMFSLNVKLALVILASVPFVLAGSIIFKKYDRDAYRDVRAKLAKINSSLSENISGVKTVQIYHKEEKMFNEFDGINKSYFQASMKQLTIFALFRPSVDLLSTLTLAGLLWFGGLKVLNQDIPVGMLFAFVSYLMQFFQPIFDLTEKYDILQSSMASAERIFLLMDNKDMIKNIENPVHIERLKGEIEFKNVWFAYNDEQWVLRDVSFKIRPGEKIAFVGATGAGKTSIISLISRLYDIQKGEILIDGINIKQMDQQELRKNLATVLQDVFLFTGDIKSNVRLNNGSITDEDIIKACKYVNADKFIEKLPNKYDDAVNERGTTFSQGERQLIAFARAIAFNPPILVLDEATSNIDTETESLIQDALNKITKDRTTIIVAHRLSTIKNADKIIVLHKGKVREIGNHEELLGKEGLYYNLYKLQYKELEGTK